ncbi:MAG: ComF family protein [Oscillospiraceae bacterium]|jgi:ComF family protein|nr:ComF family protein [Oscillospiraceae bacterium]
MLNLLLPKRCAFCRRPHPDGLCETCRDELPWRIKPYDGIVAAPLLYRGAVRSALHRYKFRGVWGGAEIFGELMAAAVRSAGAEADIITWVPCSFARRWTRGYDQARKLAQSVGKRLCLPLERTLRKIRHTRSQTKMPDSEARRANVRGAFGVRADAVIAGRRILLIDDIHTTGATLDECKRLLLGAGAASVVCCAVAARR